MYWGKKALKQTIFDTISILCPQIKTFFFLCCNKPDKLCTIEKRIFYLVPGLFFSFLPVLATDPQYLTLFVFLLPTSSFSRSIGRFHWKWRQMCVLWNKYFCSSSFAGSSFFWAWLTFLCREIPDRTFSAWNFMWFHGAELIHNCRLGTVFWHGTKSKPLF